MEIERGLGLVDQGRDVADVDRLMQVDKLARLPQPVQKLAEILLHIDALQSTGRLAQGGKLLTLGQRGNAAQCRAFLLRCLIRPPAGGIVSVEFLVTSFTIIVSPGTGVLYTLAIGLSRGSRASVVAAFGCTLGIVPHMAAAILGLAALLHTSALAFQTFKYVGVGYLLYMAWQALRARGTLKVEKEVGARSAAQLTVTAILINILNPKLSIFFLAFLPQFISVNESHPLPRMLILSGVFMLMTFVVFVGYGLFAASIRDRIISRPRVLTWMRRTFAAAFVALGAKLAFSGR